MQIFYCIQLLVYKQHTATTTHFETYSVIPGHETQLCFDNYENHE